jgi:hypothetical protein
MSTDKVTPILVDADPASGWRDGITPAVQKKLNAVARAIKRAIVATEAAWRAAKPDTDAELRCDEALAGLEIALRRMEWIPPAEH